MPKIESLKCPNCGAAVRGAGPLVCPYCGSQLRMEGAADRAYPQTFAVAETESYFNALPGVRITRETRDLPFKPVVVYENLPGGRLDPALKNDADRILSLVETCQRAVNAEDMELYLSTISKESAAFYEMAKNGATAQFIESDMKRYTTRVDFTNLTPEVAEVAVSFEAFIFPSQGPARPGVIVVNVTQHMEVTFNWLLRKINGKWKIVGAGLKVRGLGVQSGQRAALYAALVIPLIGLLIGLAAACWAIFGGPIIGVYKDLTGEAGGSPDGITGDGTTVTVEKEFFTSVPLNMYEERDKSRGPAYTIKPYEKVKVLGSENGWTRVWVDGAGYGWIPTTDLPSGVAGTVETKGDEFVVETGLVIYEKPDFAESPKYVIMPGAKVKVVKREGDWAYVRTDDGQAGWTPATLLDN